MVHFYTAFCDFLQEKHVNVLVMGFAGHSLVDYNNRRLFNLQDQIDCADQFVTEVLTESTTAAYADGVHVAGHSIGGFVALQVLARHPSIKTYFGLCPVLSHIMASPNGQRMFYWGVPVVQHVAALIGSVFALLPHSVRRWMVRRHAQALEPSLQTMIAEKVSRRVLLNVFYLVFDEFRAVTRPDKPLLASLQEKMVLYYVPKDGWAPQSYAEEINAICPNLKAFIMETDEEVPHAWCLQHTSHVIDQTLSKHL